MQVNIAWVRRLGEEPAGARSAAGKAGGSEAGRARRAGLRPIGCRQAVGADGRPGSFWRAAWHRPPPRAGTGVDSFCFLQPFALQERPNQAAPRLLHPGFCRRQQQARLYICFPFQASVFEGRLYRLMLGYSEGPRRWF